VAAGQGVVGGGHLDVGRRRVRIRDDDAALVPFRSSGEVTRSFCRRCGSSLFWEHALRPGSMWIALGTIDGDPGARPEAHIFVAARAPWFEPMDGLPQREGNDD
jgi:hypothetical protein